MMQETEPYEYRGESDGFYERSDGFYERHETTATTIEQLAHAAGRGQAVAFNNRLVYAVCGDGTSAEFVQKITMMKNRDPRKNPFALTISSDEFIAMIDRSKIHSSVHPLLKDDRSMAELSGGLVFFRAPITAEAAAQLPEVAVSHGNDGKILAQNYDPIHKDDIYGFITRARELGCKVPVITSLNEYKEREISDQPRAAQLCAKLGIPVYHGNNSARKADGSFPILEMTESGLVLLRSGNTGNDILTQIYDGIHIENRSGEHRNTKKVLHLEDLDYKDRRLCGRELANAVRQYYGWDETVPAVTSERFLPKIPRPR